MEADEPSLYRQRDKLLFQYATKLRSLPTNPTYKCIYQPSYIDLFENKPSTIPPIGLRVQRLITSSDVDISSIAEIGIINIPPWECTKPLINKDLQIGKKNETDHIDFHVIFNEIQQEYDGYNFIYTDGSKDGERAGYGVVTGRHTHKERLPNICSIYTAELKAILFALRYIICIIYISL